MCGIAGSIHHPLNIPRLTKDLLHRGPDRQASFEENNVILHHHRLSILDMEGGGQPMHYEHLTIIFNGEIYNHQDIRKKYGFRCVSSSDTETILHAYARLGAACLAEFDGMFALAIYDRKNNELFLARDRAGKKPLFYYADGNKFVFASELNALRGQLEVQPDEAAIFQFLYAGYFFEDNSPYRNIMKIPAGCYAIVSAGNPQPVVVRWWNIHDYYLQKSNHNFEEALQHTDDILHTAVKRRVESSDLEVGSFLSGGIDSGLVTAIASEYNSSIKTFTVSFQGEYDEAPLAKRVAEKYGTVHHEINIGFDHLLDDVEQIIANYGMPFFDSSAIPSYYVSQHAKKYLTVILNGDGGDEIFGGYRRYVPFSKHDFFKSGSLIRPVSKLIFPFLPISNDKKNKYNYIYRLVDLARKKGLDTYLSSTLDIFEDFENVLKGDRKTALESIRHSFDRIAASP
ncbi:MAG: asparagine synthase (glutamine-hydrolyzing) [Chitinophagaceae bacterium]|nr:asparagine synthase (glutamine-hydrolyzing) [Chitinophagaceae bacterium]